MMTRIGLVLVALSLVGCDYDHGDDQNTNDNGNANTQRDAGPPGTASHPSTVGCSPGAGL